MVNPPTALCSAILHITKYTLGMDDVLSDEKASMGGRVRCRAVLIICL